MGGGPRFRRFVQNDAFKDKELNNNNNNNRRLVTLAELTSDHGRQTNSSTEELNRDITQ